MIEFPRSRRIAASPGRIWPLVDDRTARPRWFIEQVMGPGPIRKSFDTSLARLAALTEGPPPAP